MASATHLRATFTIERGNCTYARTSHTPRGRLAVCAKSIILPGDSAGRALPLLLRLCLRLRLLPRLSSSQRPLIRLWCQLSTHDRSQRISLALVHYEHAGARTCVTRSYQADVFVFIILARIGPEQLCCVLFPHTRRQRRRRMLQSPVRLSQRSIAGRRTYRTCGNRGLLEFQTFMLSRRSWLMGFLSSQSWLRRCTLDGGF